MTEMNTNEMQIELIEYIVLLWKKKWFLIGLFVLAVSSAVFLVQQMDPIYKTSAIIMIRENEGMQSLFVGDMFSTGKNKASTYSLMIKTRTLLNQVVQRMDLRDEEGELLTASALGEKITVRPISGTDLLEISLEDKNPKKAKDIVDTIVEMFQEANVTMNKATLTGVMDFIQKQKIETEIELKKAEDELLEYKTSNKVILPTEEAKQILEQTIEIQRLKSMAEVELGSTKASIQMIAKELDKHSEKLISSTVISSNPLIKQYKGQITDLETNLVGMRAKYTENHPEVVSLKEKITHIEEALRNEVEKEVNAETVSMNPVYQSLYQNSIQLESVCLANEAKLDSYNYILQGLEKDLEELPVKELELIRLERKAKVTADIYTMLMTRAEEIKISEAMETSDVYLVDEAYIPKYPIKPNKKGIIAISGIMALIIGIFLIIIQSYFDNTVKSTEEISRLLDLPVLGSIPDISKMKNKIG